MRAANDGGASVTGYVLSYGAETVTLGATLAATVGGLAAGEEYAFTLQAANSVGLGLAATAAVAIPAVTPAAPQSLTAVAVEGGASLSWGAPAFDGGATVTGYVLTYLTAMFRKTLGVTTAATVGGLTAGDEYRRLPCKRQTAPAWGRWHVFTASLQGGRNFRAAKPCGGWHGQAPRVFNFLERAGIRRRRVNFAL